MRSAKDKAPVKPSANDNKKRTTTKFSAHPSISIADQLRQQTPSSLSKRRRNDDSQPSLSQKSVSSTTQSELAPMDMDFEFEAEPISVYQQDKHDNSDNDDNSEVTEKADNVIKELYDTRVDIRIKVPPHTNPEEKTVQVLQTFLTANFNLLTQEYKLQHGMKESPHLQYNNHPTL